jgi:hypothetical protein
MPLEDDIANLRAWGEDLAASHAPGGEPACVAAAFARQAQGVFVFTMQAWIDLVHARSPLLQGGLPETAGQAAAAFAAFDWQGVSAEEMEHEEALACFRRMRDAVNDAMAMVLDMQPRDAGELLPNDGFGVWLPLLARLIAKDNGLGMSRSEALTMPVGQAYALLAGWRHNHGWKAASVGYELRGGGLSIEPEEGSHA